MAGEGKVGGDLDKTDDGEEEEEPINTDPTTTVNIGRNVTTVNGSSVSIECAVDGDPVPEVRWMKNGVKLNVEEDDGLSVETKDKSSVLTILKAEKEDSGIYTCNASNIFGSTEEDTQVKVIGKRNRVEGMTSSTRKVYFGFGN